MTESPSPLVPLDLGKIDGWPAGVEALAEAALPDFLLRQRWYPAKDADRPEVRLAALAPLRAPGIHAAVAVWRVTPPGQSPLCLFVPLALVSATSGDDAELIAAVPANNDGAMVAIGEATSQDVFVRAWIGLLLEGAAADAQFRTEHTKHLAQANLSGAGDWSIRRGSVEQSNTSIRIGERAILKVIRKVETGINPELEISRFLSDEGDFAATPKLLGWMELAGDTEPAGAAGATSAATKQSGQLDLTLLPGVRENPATITCRAPAG